MHTSRPPIYRSTRVTVETGDTIAEVWIPTADACPYCGAGTTWASARPQVDYRICVACRRGWERCHEPHTPANNDVSSGRAADWESAAPPSAQHVGRGTRSGAGQLTPNSVLRPCAGRFAGRSLRHQKARDHRRDRGDHE